MITTRHKAQPFSVLPHLPAAFFTINVYLPDTHTLYVVSMSVRWVGRGGSCASAYSDSTTIGLWGPLAPSQGCRSPKTCRRIDYPHMKKDSNATPAPPPPPHHRVSSSGVGVGVGVLPTIRGWTHGKVKGTVSGFIKCSFSILVRHCG
jgi:hypothetical protein